MLFPRILIFTPLGNVLKTLHKLDNKNMASLPIHILTCVVFPMRHCCAWVPTYYSGFGISSFWYFLRPISFYLNIFPSAHSLSESFSIRCICVSTPLLVKKCKIDIPNGYQETSGYIRTWETSYMMNPRPTMFLVISLELYLYTTVIIAWNGYFS